MEMTFIYVDVKVNFDRDTGYVFSLEYMYSMKYSDTGHVKLYTLELFLFDCSVNLSVMS